MSMDMSEEDKKTIDTSESMNMGPDDEQSVGSNDTGFSNRDLANQSAPESDFFARQKEALQKQADAVARKTYGEDPRMNKAAEARVANQKKHLKRLKGRDPNERHGP